MGVMWDFVMSMLTESFPPKPHWTEEDIPDLSGKVFLVTGGNSGLGLETIKALVRHGGKVYLAARSKAKATKAIQEVRKTTGIEPLWLELDLADLNSVERAAQEFLKHEMRLDVLYNSGGVMIPPLEQVSAQGYDLTFASNVLGHFYLTKLLLPTLISTSRLDPLSKARIIFISSGAHHLSNIAYETLKDGPERREKGPEGLYAQSKYATVVLAKEFARRYGPDGIVSIAMNPGNVDTNLQRNVVGFRRKLIAWMLHPIVPNGIVTHLWTGTSTEALDFNGKYAVPFARLGNPRKDTQNPDIGAKLWDWLLQQVGGRGSVLCITRQLDG